MSELLNSERSELLERIKQAEKTGDERYFQALSKAIGVVNRCKWLTIEQKKELIEEFNK